MLQTIGVAVAIPDPWATDLQDYRSALGDPTAGLIPTHVTLLPPLQVDAEQLDVVQCHLTRAADAIPPFEVHLRGTGTFRPVSPVVFVSLAEGISQCELLADAVRRGPLAVDLDFPYHPHVTVAHHLDDHVLDRAFADLAGFEARFSVGCFHLYEHDPDRGWRPTRSFELAPGPVPR